MNERTTLEIIAPTVEEALAQGLAQLGLPADAVSVEVLDTGSKGLFGLGGRQVRVRLTVNPPAETNVSVAETVAKPAPAKEKPASKATPRRASISGTAQDDAPKPAPAKETQSAPKVETLPTAARTDVNEALLETTEA